MTFLNSILNNSKEHNNPFKHWELNEPLSNDAINEIISADITDLNHKVPYIRNSCPIVKTFLSRKDMFDMPTGE